MSFGKLTWLPKLNIQGDWGTNFEAWKALWTSYPTLSAPQTITYLFAYHDKLHAQLELCTWITASVTAWGNNMVCTNHSDAFTSDKARYLKLCATKSSSIKLCYVCMALPIIVSHTISQFLILHKLWNTLFFITFLVHNQSNTLL